MKRNPYGTVAAALGIGYVLGGGLFTPLTARIVRLGLRIGMRLAVLPLLKRGDVGARRDARGRAKVRAAGGKAAKPSGERKRGGGAMNLKELRNFDKDDILEMMGLQTKHSTGGWLAGTLGTFGRGAAGRRGYRAAAGAEARPRAARGHPRQAAPHGRRDHPLRPRSERDHGAEWARPTSKRARAPAASHFSGRRRRKWTGSGAAPDTGMRGNFACAGRPRLGQAGWRRPAVVVFVLAYVPYHVYVRSGLARTHRAAP